MARRALFTSHHALAVVHPTKLCCTVCDICLCNCVQPGCLWHVHSAREWRRRRARLPRGGAQQSVLNDLDSAQNDAEHRVAPEHDRAAGQAYCASLPIPYPLFTSFRARAHSYRYLTQSLEGTLKFAADLPYWTGNAFFIPFQTQVTFWLLGGKNIRLDGGGTLDGQGQAWYDALYALRVLHHIRRATC